MNAHVPLPSEQECEVLACAPAALQELVLALRDMILAAHPEATILAWPAHKIISFGYGPRKMTEHYAFIAVHAAHVNLGIYQGVHVQVPGITLEGAGKTMRHVKVRSVSEAKAAALAQLVQLAREHQGQLLRTTT